MSFETLSADPRYRDLKTALKRQNANLANPALADGRVFANVSAIADEMTALAVEHGYDPETGTWR